jgi:hypothetical protein
MFLSFVIWAKRTKVESEVVKCCPCLKKTAKRAQEMQMGHRKCEKDDMTCPLYQVLASSIKM